MELKSKSQPSKYSDKSKFKTLLYQAMPNLWTKSTAKFRIGIGNSSDMIPEKKRRGRMIAGPQAVVG